MIEAPPSLALIGVREMTSLIEVYYSFARPADATHVAALLPLIESFVCAGANGGFPLRDAGTARTTVLLSSGELISPTTVRHVLEVRDVDWRAFQLLRSMVARLRSNKIFVQSINISDPMFPSANPVYFDWPDENTEEAAYPNVTRRAESLLIFEDNDFSKVRRLLVEVDAALGPERVTCFAAWVEPWYRMLEFNAFAMPIGHPSVTDSIAGSVSQFDEVTIEISVDRFMATECAWNILASMICAFDWSSGSLVGIVVD